MGAKGTMPRIQIRTLEVIHLRLARLHPGELEELIAEVVRAGDEEGVHVYRHSRIDTDLLVQLHRQGEEGAECPSDLGSRLVSLLRDRGIVEHSVWIEQSGGES